MPLVHAEDTDQTVVVEGARPSAARTPASVTVLPLGDAVGPAEDVGSVVDSASGTVVRRLGGLGDFSALRLRGSSFRQVEICLDGVPLNPDGTDVIDLSELPTAAFSRVEIYRGNAPPSLASVAMGGVVNLITPRGADLPPRVAGAGGSFGTWMLDASAGPSAPLGAGRVDTFLTLDAFHTTGDYPYFDDQGTEFNLTDDRTPIRVNNIIDRASAIGRVRWVGKNAEIGVLDRWGTSQRGLPGPIQDPAELADYAVNQNLVVVNGTVWPTEAVRVDARGWWITRNEFLDDEAAELGTSADLYRERTDTLGAQADLTAAPLSWLNAGLTLRWRSDSEQASDEIQHKVGARNDRDTALAAVSANVHLWRDRIELAPVLHAEWIGPRTNTGGEALTTENNIDEGAAEALFLLPRAGAAFRPWSWVTLRGNVGLYARPPGFDELYGDSGVMVGNTSLRAEHGLGMDVGARITTPDNPWLNASFDAAYARNTVDDLIVWVQNSQYTTRAENIGKAYVRSIEGAVTLDVRDVLRSQSNVTWMLSRNLLSDPTYANKTLPGLPELEFTQTTTVHWQDRVSLSHTWSYTSGTFLDAANAERTAPRDLHGITLSVTPLAGLPTVQLQVLNLFDVRGAAVDRDPLSDDDDALVIKPLADFAGYPLPGRTLMLGVSWSPPQRTTKP